MTRPVLASLFVVAMSLVIIGCDSISSPTSPSSISQGANNSNGLSGIKEVVDDALDSGPEIPKVITGVELMTIRGWLANLYPWEYVPSQSAVYPVPFLWTPNRMPTSFQMMEQCQQIKEFGGGAAVLTYNPNPSARDSNYWLSNGFASGCGPFFLLYEHINGTRYFPANLGPKNMNDENNRRVFREDIDYMFNKVIIPNQSRYVTVNGRAVIYMWSTVQMTGDFASLLEEAKKNYPIFFIGSMEFQSGNAESLARVKALDGFMEYSLGGRSDYLRTVQDYNSSSISWRSYLRRLENETGKRYLFIPTFQVAYDDTNVSPKRNNPPMYARSRDEVRYHVEMIRSGMGSVYDFSVGPFVVYSELPEGAAVIESQCLPSTVDSPGRFVGCGKARLEILKESFSW